MLHIDLQYWVETLGYVGLFIIIFAETGLLIGFFLPGDSLVFTAGLLAAHGFFDIRILVTLLVLTAILGYQTGFYIGYKLGHFLNHRNDTWYYKKKYVTQAHEFYQKHGPLALVIGRLIPIVRTFIPLVAGMVKMPVGRFTLYNIVGAVVWGAGITLLGYYLGTLVPNAKEYLMPVIFIIVFLSILPSILHFLRAAYHRRKQRKLNGKL